MNEPLYFQQLELMWEVFRSNELNLRNLQVKLRISDNTPAQPLFTKILLKGRRCFKPVDREHRAGKIRLTMVSGNRCTPPSLSFQKIYINQIKSNKFVKLTSSLWFSASCSRAHSWSNSTEVSKLAGDTKWLQRDNMTIMTTKRQNSNKDRRQPQRDKRQLQETKNAYRET